MVFQWFRFACGFQCPLPVLLPAFSLDARLQPSRVHRQTHRHVVDGLIFRAGSEPESLQTVWQVKAMATGTAFMIGH